MNLLPSVEDMLEEPLVLDVGSVLLGRITTETQCEK